MMWSTASTSKDSNTNTGAATVVAGDTSGGGRAGVATSTFSSTTTSSAVNVLEIDPESNVATNDGADGDEISSVGIMELSLLLSSSVATLEYNRVTRYLLTHLLSFGLGSVLCIIGAAGSNNTVLAVGLVLALLPFSILVLLLLGIRPISRSRGMRGVSLAEAAKGLIITTHSLILLVAVVDISLNGSDMFLLWNMSIGLVLCERWIQLQIAVATDTLPQEDRPGAVAVVLGTTISTLFTAGLSVMVVSFARDILVEEHILWHVKASYIMVSILLPSLPLVLSMAMTLLELEESTSLNPNESSQELPIVW